MAVLVDAYAVLMALLIGSFINLAADRVPRRESLISPRSHCRSCGRVLNVIDLLPVLGYAIRFGRCATCKASIGLSAPAVEAASAVLVAAPILWLGPWPGALYGFLLVALFGVGDVALAVRGSRRDQRASSSA